MAKMNVDGLDGLISGLDLLYKDVQRINSKALYEGAGVVADEIKDGINNMPVRSDGRSEHRLRGATASEREQIASCLGISKHKRESGSISATIGFGGYIHTPSKKYNDQVPAAMLIQCIEFGTSFRQGTHTITNAAKSAKEKAVETIEKSINDSIKEYTG